MPTSKKRMNKQHKNSLELLSAIRDQLNGKALPSLEEMEGVQLSIEARGGLLNWRILEAPDASVIRKSGLKVSIIPSFPTW